LEDSRPPRGLFRLTSSKTVVKERSKVRVLADSSVGWPSNRVPHKEYETGTQEIVRLLELKTLRLNGWSRFSHNPTLEINR